MSKERPHLGSKLRGIRRREGLTQAGLAKKLGISGSYLNLIENNRRPLTAPLLIKLAELFDLDLRTLSAGDDDRLVAELLEVFGDTLFDSHDLTNADVQELAHASPGIARAIPTLYRALRHARETVAGLESSLSGEEELEGLSRTQLPSEEVSDVLQTHQNHFAELEDAAATLRRSTGLGRGLTDPFPLLVQALERDHAIRVQIHHRETMLNAMRRLSLRRGVLALSEMLTPGSRRFQLAHVLGLLSCGDVLDGIVSTSKLSTDEARALCRVALANYLASAVLMPYGPFLEAAERERYDIEILLRRFGTSFEQTCHRLTTLHRPGHSGVPFHLIRIDIAGNISKRFSASGLHFPRFSASCPLWNVHTAFHTPGQLNVQLSRMPDGAMYLSIARTIRRSSGGYNAPAALQSIAMGCAVQHAPSLVYADGLDLNNPDAAVPVGVTCRLCERMDCEQRAFPPLHHPLKVNEDVRGLSFYAPVT